MQSGYNYSMLDCFGGIECVNAQYKNVHLAKHVHEGYAIGVINQGVQKFNSLGCNHSAGTGSLVIVNADTVHTGESIRDVGCNYRALYPTPESIDTILSDLPSSKSCAPYFTNPILHDTELIELLKTIFSHSDNQSPKLVMESLLFTFFAKLVVRQSHSRLSLNTANASSNIDKVRDYLNEYAQQNISLDELARIGNVNKYTLIRQFKQKWGLLPPVSDSNKSSKSKAAT